MSNEYSEQDSDFEELVVEWVTEQLHIENDMYSFYDICNLNELIELLNLLLPDLRIFQYSNVENNLERDFVTNRMIFNNTLHLLGISPQYYVPERGYTMETIPSFKTMLMVLLHKLIDVVGEEDLYLPILLREMVLNAVTIMNRDNGYILSDLLMEYKPKFWHSYLQDEMEIKKMQCNFSDMEDLEYPEEAEEAEEATEQTSDDYKNRIESLIYQWLNRMETEGVGEERNSNYDFLSKLDSDELERCSDDSSILSDPEILEMSKGEGQDNCNLDWLSLYKDDLSVLEDSQRSVLLNEAEGVLANERSRQKVDGIKAFLQILGDKKQYFKDDQN